MNETSVCGILSPKIRLKLIQEAFYCPEEIYTIDYKHFFQEFLKVNFSMLTGL